jgi:hypothetical protein
MVWKGTAPLTLVPANRPNGIFHEQSDAEGGAWQRYWAQVDAFNPDKDITVADPHLPGLSATYGSSSPTPKSSSPIFGRNRTRGRSRRSSTRR